MCLGTKNVIQSKVGVEDSEDSRKCGATHVNFVLDAIELSLE